MTGAGHDTHDGHRTAPRSGHGTPFVIGVAGGSGSGKTTVAEALAQEMTDRVALVKLDAYYVHRPDLELEERARMNYDHPDSFEWSLLLDHLDQLLNGEPIPVPVYDYTHHARSDRVEWVQPSPIVVVEGILVLYEAALRYRFDLKVFVDTDDDVRFIRRLQRDVAERDRTPESVVEQYLETVRPSHLQFVEPSKRYADVIIPHGGMNAPAIDVLLARVRELLR